MSESDNNDNNNVPGYIYIMQNEMYQFYGSDVYKIGKAKNIRPFREVLAL